MLTPTPERGSWGAHYCEGYDAFYEGLEEKDCPYPATNEVVAGGSKDLTCNFLRHGWLEGWRIARNEISESSAGLR